jgi:nitrate/TMAO reductase-like tetraheme cytochrome c subunit
VTPVRWALALAIAGIAALALPALAQEPTNEDCLTCHGMEGFVGSDNQPLEVNAEKYAASMHGSLPCVACHDDIKEIPHEAKLKDPEPEACAICHSEVAETYAGSIHGEARAKGETEPATCTSCHGPPHEILGHHNPASPVYPLNLPRACGKCHDNPELAERHGIPVVNAYELYMDSIHGRALTRSGLLVSANCSSCHGFHDIRPKNDPKSRVARVNVVATCGSCHAGIEEKYRQSSHGIAYAKGDARAPVCIDCHSAHKVARVESHDWKLLIVRECGTCHEAYMKTYRQTFHGQVTALGFTVLARCSDCHGSHLVLPPSDPRSTVSSANIVATCGKCHKGSNANFVQFAPHADVHDRDRYPWLYYTAFFMNTLIIGVFAFFGLHTVLWFIRSMVEQARNHRRK